MSLTDDGGKGGPTRMIDLVPDGQSYAFPFVIPGEGLCPGMSLRDWFAGQALAGTIAASNYDKEDWAEIFASEAYAVADAMLAARKAP